MIYGHDKTIHQTDHIDVEVGPDGKVIGVWFRRLMLPFRETRVSQARASELAEAYRTPPARVLAIEVTSTD